MMLCADGGTDGIMNKAILMGRLTKDPELKYTTSNNVPVCSFSLAVNRRFSKEGSQQADFINIVTWRNTAEFCAKWFKKGKQVAVVGSIQTRNWDDTEGKRHYATEVVADEVYFADSKRDGDTGRDFDGFNTGANMTGSPGGAFGSGNGFSAGALGQQSSSAPENSSGSQNSPGGASAGGSGEDEYYPVEDDTLPF